MSSEARSTAVTPSRASLDEQAAAKGAQPIGDGSWYARPELFDEPGELEAFIEFVRESRRLGTTW